MIIYVDLVFFLNVLLDFILLMSVSVILKRNAKIKRLILGSIIGGVSTLILYIPLNGLLITILKLLLGIIMIIVTFSFRSVKYTLNNYFYLLTNSFSLGGVLYLLMEKHYYNYYLIIIVFIITSYLYVKQLKQYQNNYSNYYLVEIYLNDNKIVLTGLLDTGNKLYDMYKHRPIILIDKNITYQVNNYIYVPYLSLNNEGVIKCFKADKVVINNCVFRDYLIGLAKQKFKIDGINCLLHSDMKGKL